MPWSGEDLEERFLSYGQQLQDLFAGDTPPSSQAFAAFCQNLIVEASLLAQLAHANLSPALPEASPPEVATPAPAGPDWAGPVVEAAAPARPGLMKRSDVADYLGVSIRQVDEFIASGDLVPIRMGRSVRFDPRTVDAFVRACVRGAGVAAERPARRVPSAARQKSSAGEVQR